MHFGASMSFTDCSMTAAELAQAFEARSFESVWAPEHSHIPTSRRTPFPGGGELPKQYYDAPAPKADAVLPTLDKWAALIRQVNG